MIYGWLIWTYLLSNISSRHLLTCKTDWWLLVTASLSRLQYNSSWIKSTEEFLEITSKRQSKWWLLYLCSIQLTMTCGETEPFIVFIQENWFWFCPKEVFYFYIIHWIAFHKASQPALLEDDRVGGTVSYSTCFMNSDTQ